MKNKKQKWVINIGGYGAFFFEGNETQAEEMRVHKANWEQGIGKKRIADKTELETGITNDCWNHPNFNNKTRYKCKCGNC